MLAAQLGKRVRQLVERTAHDAHVVRVPQVRRQGGLRRLVFQIAAQLGAAQSPPQALFRNGEEVLDDVVGAVDDDHRPARAIAGHGMPAQPGAVAVQVSEDDRLGRAQDRAGGLLRGDPLAQLPAVALQVGGQKTTQNNFLLDGVDNNGVELAGAQRRSEMVQPSIDAIQEFKVQTNA